MGTAPLDGNAVAGQLGEVFAFDVTVAVSRCRACGDRRPVAELRAWVEAPGAVLRCAGCDGVLVRLVRAPDRLWLDLRGVDVLQIPLRD